MAQIHVNNWCMVTLRADAAGFWDEVIVDGGGKDRIDEPGHGDAELTPPSVEMRNQVLVDFGGVHGALPWLEWDLVVAAVGRHGSVVLLATAPGWSAVLG